MRQADLWFSNDFIEHVLKLFNIIFFPYFYFLPPSHSQKCIKIDALDKVKHLQILKVVALALEKGKSCLSPNSPDHCNQGTLVFLRFLHGAELLPMFWPSSVLLAPATKSYPLHHVFPNLAISYTTFMSQLKS